MKCYSALVSSLYSRLSEASNRIRGIAEEILILSVVKMDGRLLQAGRKMLCGNLMPHTHQSRA